MPRRLRKEEIVTIQVLAEKGENHCQIARRMGVSEGTVRYHLRRAAEGARDGRANKAFQAEEVSEVIRAWHELHREQERPANVLEL